MESKVKRLTDYLASLGSAVIAFSGGVDSTLLAMAGMRALGDNAVAVTAVSPTLTAEEKADCTALAERIGIKHVFIESGEMTDADFVKNDAKKCYYCKRVRMRQICDWAEAHGYAYVAEGSNTDDAKDYRPGTQALAELAMIVSPLAKAGFGKADIRRLSREWELPTWNKESSACLASRIAYGMTITEERLREVEEGERIVREYVQGQVRVRHHGEVARIEAEEDMMPVLMRPDIRQAVTSRMKAVGFRYVTLDMVGYRMGSLNESLDKT